MWAPAPTALLAQIPRPRRPRYGPGAKLQHQAEDYTLAFDVGVTGEPSGPVEQDEVDFTITIDVAENKSRSNAQCNDDVLACRRVTEGPARAPVEQ